MTEVNVEVEPDDSDTPPADDAPDNAPTVVIADTGDDAADDGATDRWVENERAHAALSERLETAERFTGERLTAIEERIAALEAVDDVQDAAIIETAEAVAGDEVENEGIDDTDEADTAEPRSAGPHPLFRSWHDTFRRGE